MAASHSAPETKQHPAVSAFENFYKVKTITSYAEELIAEKKDSEYEFHTRIQYISQTEREMLSKWAHARFVPYFENPTAPNLTRREQTWLGIMFQYGIGVEKNPEKAANFFKLAAARHDGLAYFLLDDFRKALDYTCFLAIFDIALSERKNHHTDLYESMKLGDTRAMDFLGQYHVWSSNPGEGINILMEGAKRGDPDCMDWLVIAYQHLGRFQTAFQIGEAILKRLPNHHFTLLNMGMLYRDFHHDLGSAAKCFRYSLTYNHGTNEKDYRMAMNGIRHLFETNPENPAVVFHIALAMMAFHAEADPEFANRFLIPFNKIFTTNANALYDLIAKDTSPEKTFKIIFGNTTNKPERIEQLNSLLKIHQERVQKPGMFAADPMAFMKKLEPLAPAPAMKAALSF